MKTTGLLTLCVVTMAMSGCSFDTLHNTTWTTACDFDSHAPGCDDAEAGLQDVSSENGDVEDSSDGSQDVRSEDSSDAIIDENSSAQS